MQPIGFKTQKRRLNWEIVGKKRAIDRYLRAFEQERLSEQSCVIDEIVVESRACIQPYFFWLVFVWLNLRRRRRFNHAKNSVPGHPLCV
jgi:hypothetical protein